jgi:hypothetical protein
MTSRIGRAWAAAAMLIAMVCGCSVVPVGRAGGGEDSPVGDPMSKQFVRMVAFPPRPEWTPEQVVQGLLAAMAAYPDDQATLAEYLTPRARAAWKPAGPVTVVQDASKLEADEERGTATLTGVQIAGIESDDRYVPVTGGGQRTFKYTLKKGVNTSGQTVWLIDSLEDGLVLTAADVERSYRPAKLYFLNGGSSSDGRGSVVSDSVRVRLRPDENLAETIVRRLLKGPSSALRGAVTSAVPENLSVESVTATDERILIDLDGFVDLASLDLDGMKAQFAWSLRTLASGNRPIELQRDGEPLAAGLGSIALEDYKSWGSDHGSGTAYYTSGGEVRWMSGGDGPGNPIHGPAGQRNEYADLALAAGADTVAGVAKDGIVVTPDTPEGTWQRVIQGDRLTGPSWHRDGSLWTYDRRAGTVLRSTADPAQPPVRIAAPALDGLDVTDLRIARDGVRVAVRIGSGEIRVGAVTGGGSAMMLGNFQSLLKVPDEQQITDVAWRDDEHLLILISSSKAGPSVQEVNVGDGKAAVLTLADKRVKSIAASGARILAGTGQEIIEYKDQGWTTNVKEGAQYPIFPLG